MKKVARRYKQAAEAAGAKVLSMVVKRGHFHITIECCGKQKTFTCAGSPTNEDISVRNFSDDIRRYCQ